MIHQGTILVVDDTHPSLKLLTDVLTAAGYEVRPADSGELALASVAARPPELILLDIRMPGMDGFEVFRRLKTRERSRDIPVMFLSAVTETEQRVEGLKLGAVDFIPKPFQAEELLARVRTHMEMSRLRARLEHEAASLQSANDELQSRQAELTRANAVLTGLYRVSEGLNQCTTERTVAETVLERAMGLPNVQAGWITLLDGHDRFHTVATRGLPQALRTPEAFGGDCLCRRKLLSGELDKTTNILECERLGRAEGDTGGLRYHAAVPLWIGDRMLGVMNLAGPGEMIFSEDDRKVFDSIGNQCGVALERARLRDHLEAEVEDRTAALRLEINERELTEQALRISEAKFRSLFEHVMEGIHQSTDDGRLLVVNPAFVRMLGYESEAEALALDFARDIYVAPEERATFLRSLREKGEVRNVEARFKRKDGRVITVLRNARVVRDEQGAALYYEGTIVDISERKQIEEQLRQSQKVEAIGQLAGGIAHDFNNVLTTIKGYCDLLIEALYDSDVRKQDVAEIAKAADRAAALTRQLLAFSRRQILEPRVLDLRSVVGELDPMLRRLIGEDIELTTLAGRDLGRVKADPNQIEQVLMNLAINARDAMSTSGKLTIETMNVDLDEDYARQHVAVQPGPYVLLAVSDTGSGMDAETLSHIFEPFFTTKEKGKGTGLGLSTVYGIVKQSGGNIWVYSEPGRGTAFKIYLPRVEEVVEQVAPDTARSQAVGGAETVLLVEDEEGVRKIVCRVLRLHGYTVLEAPDPRNGLDLSAAHPGRIHLLITDVVLPQMSGAALADQIMQERPDTKVLYMSGYTDNAIVHHGVLDPEKAFLQKPFTPDLLARKVREVLDRS